MKMTHPVWRSVREMEEPVWSEKCFSFSSPTAAGFSSTFSSFNSSTPSFSSPTGFLSTTTSQVKSYSYRSSRHTNYYFSRKFSINFRVSKCTRKANITIDVGTKSRRTFGWLAYEADEVPDEVRPGKIRASMN